MLGLFTVMTLLMKKEWQQDTVELWEKRLRKGMFLSIVHLNSSSCLPSVIRSFATNVVSLCVHVGPPGKGEIGDKTSCKICYKYQNTR